MSKTLEQKLSNLKIGKTMIVMSALERIQCFNIAGRIGITIKTKKPFSGIGFDIHRVK